MTDQKIDQLIAAIEKLVDALTLQHIVKDDPAAVNVPSGSSAPVEKTAFTQEEVKKFCLTKVRENANFKAELAEVLKGYEAKTLSKLTEEQLQVVAKMVGMV